MENTFPGFAHTADELSAYLVTLGIFVISFKEQIKPIDRFTPGDEQAFRTWLNHHKIRDITHEAGTLVLTAYASKK